MSQTTVQLRFENILSRIQQPARLIGNEFGSGPGFSGRADELRVVLGFPDVYEIGISNQAIQILYHLAAGVEGVAVERTYLPWVDAIAEMRREGVPLLTLETWSPLVEADLLGLTLQHEFNYTNVLELLDLAGVPLHASERTEEHPLVLGGGPATADFLPLSRFLDAVAVGDGEELFPEILQVMVGAKREGVSRLETKRRLSLVSGIYVPGLSDAVTRRVLPRLEGAPYPGSCLVPLTAGVHDRAWVEVMRGCTRGCRFCQAGMWYRPVRERSPEEVTTMAEAQLAASGHQELAFASLSTTDYSCLEGLLAETVRTHPELRISLPSLRVDSAAIRLAHLVSPTGPSLTLAPEAGSARMRAIINKNVSEADVLAAAEEAFHSGRTTLKLYFMIGLPLETDADVAAIADLCLRLRDLGRRKLGSQAGRVQLNVSVNNFVPKPFTPFQWAGMADRETLLRRQDLLRRHLRKSGVRLALHDVDKSYLEAALARGGDDMGGALEEAWMHGARFDSWTEHFRGEAWSRALASAGTSAEALATATIPRELPLPWDVIHGVVGRDFLWAEWERALSGESTADCRWEECSDCGVCVAALGNDLADTFGGAPRTPDSGAVVAGPGAHPLPARSATLGREAPRLRYLLTFAVTGRGRFIGHLDRAEILRRAVRKAGGRLALSAGMRPKPLLSLALPLAVGVEGLRELCGFELAEEPSASFVARLATALPADMLLLAVEPYEATRSVPARVVRVAYDVQVRAATQGRPAAAGPDRQLIEAVERFADAPELMVEEERDGRVRRIDVKRYVDHLRVEAGAGGVDTLSFEAAVTPAGTARPERVVKALIALASLELEIKRITRTRIELS
ncbi:MAG: TIGR03936 family radical SAM-associated protein [bacterium]